MLPDILNIQNMLFTNLWCYIVELLVFILSHNTLKNCAVISTEQL